MLPTPQIVNNEISSGEKLLWWGQPEPFKSSIKSFGIWIFAIPWTAFACFWVYMACFGVLNSKNHMGPIAWAFPLFGLPFILIGLAMLSAPFLVLYKLRNTYYLLTDKRLVVLTNGSTRTSQSYELEGLTNLVRTEYGDRGDLTWTVIGAKLETPRSGMVSSGSAAAMSNSVTLSGITEPRKIEKLVSDSCQKLIEKRRSVSDLD